MWCVASVLFLAWSHLCTAFHDSVIFSKQPMRKMTVEEVAEASGKVLAVGVRDFSLPGFNKYAQAYSAQISDGPLTSMKQIFANSKALPMENPLKVPRNEGEAQQPADGIKYIKVDVLEDLRKFLLHQENLKSYDTVVISSQNAFENELVRHKRVSSDVTFDEEPAADEFLSAGKQGSNRQQLDAANGSTAAMPVVLPPMDSLPQGNTSCLLYMEAFDIIIPSSKGTSYLTVDSESSNRYTSSPDHYECHIQADSYRGYASFIIDVTVGKEIKGGEFSLSSGTSITLQLDFTGAQANGYWYLNSTVLKGNFNIGQTDGGKLTVNSGTAVNPVDVGSVPRFNFACSQTQAAYFNTSNADVAKAVGIALRNFEVNLGLPKLTGGKLQFGYYTTDCIGTFSAGTWMGIIIAFVFVVILLFGYLMVQSIQTMDRFDDPKQKQIVINFKE